jgi:hypothetical protein
MVVLGITALVLVATAAYLALGGPKKKKGPIALDPDNYVPFEVRRLDHLAKVTSYMLLVQHTLHRYATRPTHAASYPILARSATQRDQQYSFSTHSIVVERLARYPACQSTYPASRIPYGE